MSVGPRIVFVRFAAIDSPKLTPWLGHLQRVVGLHSSVSAPHTDSGNVFVWQLMSANNRQLARSADVRDTVEVALADAREVVDSCRDLSIELVGEESRGVYGWYAAIEGRPVMTCARWYLSGRDRRHSIDIAMSAVETASLRPGVRSADPALGRGDRVSLA
jgi:hypothetical protein